MRAFIDQHRDTHGVEQICKVLRIAPSGYRRHAARQRNPALRCQRARRDDILIPQIERVWQVNLQVYGADKVWHQLNREGVTVARCTVERLMRRLGLQGVRRGKVVRTTFSNAATPFPLDRVSRQFKADRPNQLWVSDFTFILTLIQSKCTEVLHLDTIKNVKNWRRTLPRNERKRLPSRTVAVPSMPKN